MPIDAPTCSRSDDRSHRGDAGSAGVPEWPRAVQSKAHFPCPICGGRAVRALSDTHGRLDLGDFYCLDHKEPFRAPLMQSDKEGTVNKDQEIIALEVEKQLREKYESGGGCIYLSLSEWAERLGVSEGDFLRQFAELVDAGKVKPSVIEICG